MGKRTLVCKPVPRERPTAGDASIEGLVDQLVQQAKQTQAKRDHLASAPRNGNGQSIVLLDLEVDGVRCMLTRSAPAPPRDTLVLSPREQEISRMVMKGYPNKTIAKVLDISVWTVGTHLRRIFAKLGVGTRASMVAQLLETGHGKLAP
jgi:DNA-binding CsgD family transcriptional regulator